MPLSEFDIISRFFAQPELSFAVPGIDKGIGDDAAILSVPDDQVVTASMDVLVADVHFPVGAGAARIGQRALAVNLSDLAAMGSKPWCFTLGLVIPEADAQWLQDLAGGLSVLAQRYQCPLVGGDISRGPLSLSIQVQGLNHRDKLIRRDGAQPGDLILVTGALGDGAFGLANEVSEVIRIKGHPLKFAPQTDAQSAYFSAAYWTPEPRVSFAERIAGRVSAGLDVSDGLLGDLTHILQASAVGARIELAKLPYSCHAEAVSDRSSCELAALYGGDDYELCLTANPSELEGLNTLAEQSGLPLTVIGEIISDPGLHCIDVDGQTVDHTPSSYQHFKR